MCRINPRVDFAFKKLFGSEENKDLLISLINAIVSEEDQVVDITLMNPYNLAQYQAGKMSILDIKAKDHNERWYNIEMQINEDLNFDKRAIYYWAKLVTDQLSEGMMFRELKKTVSINILDFNFVPDKEQYHSLYKIINTSTGKDDHLHDIFELHYIELSKFRKEYNELVVPLDRWITFLTRAHSIQRDNIPESLSSDPAILKAITAVDRMFDEEERLVYDVRMQALAETKGLIASAEEKGLAKGIAKGLEKGLEKGIAKGKMEGLMEGRKKERITMAVNLLDILDNSTIAKKTGLTLKEVENLRDASNNRN